MDYCFGMEEKVNCFVYYKIGNFEYNYSKKQSLGALRLILSEESENLLCIVMRLTADLQAPVFKD